MESKKTIKVSFNDETKRFKISDSYEQLVDLVTKSYDNLPKTFKFYYLDEDYEIISVSSDDDLKEVLESDSQTITKFVIAENQNDARQALSIQMEEPNSARLRSQFSDMNLDQQMKPLKTETDKLGLDFEKISLNNLAESFVDNPLEMDKNTNQIQGS